MGNISNNPKGKMDKYLGMYREDDTVFSDFIDRGGYYEASYDKPLLINYVNRLNRYRVDSKPYLYTGTLTSGTQSIVVDNTKTFTDLSGKVMVTVNGTGKNQARRILSNTTTALTLENALEFPIDNTTTYQIIDPTIINLEDLNAIYSCYLTTNHVIILPEVLSDYNGSSVILYNEVAVNSKLYIITQPNNTTDNITTVTSLDNSRELVQIVQHFTSMPHWDTLYTNGFQVGAVIGNTASYDVTVNPHVYKELNGTYTMTMDASSRFELIPTSKLEYTSTIPRLLTVTGLINAQVVTPQDQTITARFMYYNKSSNTTTEVARTPKSTTLSGAGATSELTIVTKIRFSQFDRIWIEVKNDNATRTFRILDSVIII